MIIHSTCHVPPPLWLSCSLLSINTLFPSLHSLKYTPSFKAHPKFHYLLGKADHIYICLINWGPFQRKRQLEGQQDKLGLFLGSWDIKSIHKPLLIFPFMSDCSLLMNLSLMGHVLFFLIFLGQISANPLLNCKFLENRFPELLIHLSQSVLPSTVHIVSTQS